MKGAFQNVNAIQALSTSSVPVSISNLGIAAVVPSYLLREILFSAEALRQRKKR
jgi:hypothetical protein